MEMKESNRNHYIDKLFDCDCADVNYQNSLFSRVVAKERKFTKVDFRYTIFDTCYFRLCVFDSCDFTGCRFTSTNLVGSKFDGCKFDYAVFERTQVDDDILRNGAPGWENLKLNFARSLRMNYWSLGDVASARKAMTLELKATEVHLKKGSSGFSVGGVEKSGHAVPICSG